MTVIELPDEQAAALTAKAAEDGLSLQDWLGKLAETRKAESAPAEQSLEDRPIWEAIQDILKEVPEEVFDRLPKDGASQVDHYIYGLPKRE
jgi:hypothetical protein